MKTLTMLFGLLLLSGCSNGENTSSKEGIALGEKVFNSNCVSCHGVAGQGLTKNWKQPLSGGKYPPPPLNGSAHTWHHSPQVILRTINQGGVKLGGSMPGFKDKLTEQEKYALIDYLYALWPDDIQRRYDKQYKQ